MDHLIAAIIVALASASANANDLLAPGDPFPAWSLTDHNGATVASSTLAGKTYLIWFYPKAMTPGCTAEGQGLRDHFSSLQQAGIAVFGVSFDPPAANAAFVQAEHFPFALLSDSQHTLATSVGAATSAQQPAARRISYLVGADGRVLKTYASVDPATHADEVVRDVAALRK